MANNLHKVNIVVTSDEGASASFEDWMKYKKAIIQKVAAFGGVDYVYPLTEDSYNVFATLCLSGTNKAELAFLGTGANTNLYFGVCGKDIPAFTQPYVSLKDFTTTASFWGNGCTIYGVTDGNNKLIALAFHTSTSSNVIKDTAMFFYRENGGTMISFNNMENGTVSTKYYSRITDITVGDNFCLENGYMYNVGSPFASTYVTPTGKAMKMANLHSGRGDYYYYIREYPVNMVVENLCYGNIRQNILGLKITVDGQKYFQFGGYQWMPYDTYSEETVTIHVEA